MQLGNSHANKQDFCLLCHNYYAHFGTQIIEAKKHAGYLAQYSIDFEVCWNFPEDRKFTQMIMTSLPQGS